MHMSRSLLFSIKLISMAMKWRLHECINECTQTVLCIERNIFGFKDSIPLPKKQQQQQQQQQQQDKYGMKL